MINRDGTYVVFTSLATDLVAGSNDNNPFQEVFLYERATTTVTLVSHFQGRPGVTANEDSFGPVISGDGAYVAFMSVENLAGGRDLNAFIVDAFLWERATGTVTLVSHAFGNPNLQTNLSVGVSAISGDGAYVVLASRATNLVAASDGNGGDDVFLYERATGTMTLLSHVAGSPNTTGNDVSHTAVISQDGTVVVFGSAATDLVSADLNGSTDVFAVAFGRRTLTVSVGGTGSGTVTSMPGGATCPSECTQSYDVGTVVTLTANFGAGSAFAGWGRACTGTGSCVVTMDVAKAVQATFGSAPVTLTVQKAGTGSGTVDSNPRGIDCGGVCSHMFPLGTVVSLRATPTADSVFVGWGGVDLDCQDGIVTLTASRTCTATFERTVTLTVETIGAGSGTVVSDPPGIACGGAQPVCAALFAAGRGVTLTATPAAGAQFGGWDGCDDTTPVGNCVLTLGVGVGRTVTAAFTLGVPALTVTLNQDEFHTGEELVLRGVLVPGAVPVRVDAYVVVELVDGSRLSLTLGRSLVAGLVPIATNIEPPPDLPPVELLRYRFTGGEPAGAYAWLTALTETGTGTVIGGPAGIRRFPFRFSP